jgi:hypothetical protein
MPTGGGSEERLKRAIVYVLSSAMFWLFAIFLVLVDLAIFAWQVRCAAAA